MRFLQLHAFYSDYLDAFYAARPGLAGEPYETQLEAILADGFSASHLFAPIFRRQKMESRLLIGNCAPLQRRWLLENDGQATSAAQLGHEVVRRQIEAFRPHALYITDPITFDSRFIRSLSYRPYFIFGWRAAEFPAWVDMTSFQLILSNEPGCRRLAESHGAWRTRHFLPGFPEWIAEQSAGEPKEHDVVFCGNLTRLHTRRVELLERLSRHALATGSFEPKFCVRPAPGAAVPCAEPHAHPTVWGMEMHRTIKRARIGLNSVIDFARGEAGNMRQFEVTGTGSFLLTESNPALASQFVPGSEIETYSSFDELTEKISYYLSHEDEREAIAKRGQERCLREHGMLLRAQELLEIVNEGLRGPSLRAGPSLPLHQELSPANESEQASELLTQAMAMLKENRADESFRLVLAAQAIDENCPHLLYLRALCLLKLNRLEDALDDLAREAELNPHNDQAVTLHRYVAEALRSISGGVGQPG